MKITTEDLLSALTDALAKPSDGTASTVREMATALHCGEDKVRGLLQVIFAEGRLVTEMVGRAAIDGTVRMVPGYRIKARPKQ